MAQTVDVAIIRTDGGSTWRGIVIEDGVAEYHTIEMWEQEADLWLEEAQNAAESCMGIPTMCPRCCGIRYTTKCDNC